MGRSSWASSFSAFDLTRGHLCCALAVWCVCVCMCGIAWMEMIACVWEIIDTICGYFTRYLLIVYIHLGFGGSPLKNSICGQDVITVELWLVSVH